MKIEKFDRKACALVKAALEEALKNVSIEGMSFTVGPMRYTNNSCSIKLEAETSGAVDEKQKDIKTCAKAFGLDLEKNGYKLIDYHRRKNTYPFIVKGENGRTFKMNLDQVRLALESN